MSKADIIFMQNMHDIIDHGYSDENAQVRPHWLDGTPAHTKKTVLHCKQIQLAGGISRNHIATHGIQKCRRRIVVDLAKEKQQRSRPSFPHLGQLGGRNGKYRQGLRLSVGRQAPLQGRNVRPGGQGTVRPQTQSCKQTYHHQHLCTQRPFGNAFVSLRLFGNIQRYRRKTQRHSQPTFQRHGCCQQLECGAVRPCLCTCLRRFPACRLGNSCM